MGEVPTKRLLRRRGRRGSPPTGRRLAVLAVLALGLGVPTVAAGAGESITPTIRGTAGANGWYRSKVTVNWVIQPAPDSSSGCDAYTLTADTRGTTRKCSADWYGTGAHIDRSLTIKIDKTPPAARGAASRPPDANGWYNHPLTVAFSGSDGTSGVASCSSAPYSGPDNPGASVAGTCTDYAGNLGRTSFPFKYDATPPSLRKVRLRHFNRSIQLSWIASSDAQLTEVQRSSNVRGAKTATVYRGPAKKYRDRHLRVGAKYHYAVIAFDQAANSTTRKVTAVATGPLLSPVPAAHVKSPPRLVWTRVKGATYYNVQMIRGNKILSAWPTKASLKLPRSWTYKGHRYRLHRGLYQWYVWPAFGSRSAGHFGNRLGGSSFVFAG
jgi:hypothetical protein